MLGVPLAGTNRAERRAALVAMQRQKQSVLAAFFAVSKIQCLAPLRAGPIFFVGAVFVFSWSIPSAVLRVRLPLVDGRIDTSHF